MKKIRTNRERLVCQSVIGEITSPLGGANPYLVDPDGKASILPGVGGITYNLRVGDPACGLAADHVEPGVSISNFTQFAGQPGPNRALNQLACAGNTARVVSGEAKGKTGRVTGKHGGIEHVLIDFEPEVLEELTIGDKIQIKAFGCGLEVEDCRARFMNLDPDLLEAMEPTLTGDGGIEMPVTRVIGAEIMGSGIGSRHSYSGDYDIQMFDAGTVEKYGLDELRLGDLVMIENADATYGRIYCSGARVVGIVVHSACVLAGHGPGVMTIASSREGLITPRLDPGANLANLFEKF